MKKNIVSYWKYVWNNQILDNLSKYQESKKKKKNQDFRAGYNLDSSVTADLGIQTPSVCDEGVLWSSGPTETSPDLHTQLMSLLSQKPLSEKG